MGQGQGVLKAWLGSHVCELRDALDGVQVLPHIISPALHTPRLKDDTSESLTGQENSLLTAPEPRFQGGFHDPSILAHPVLQVVYGLCPPQPPGSEQTRGAKPPHRRPFCRAEGSAVPRGVGHAGVFPAAPRSSDSGSGPREGRAHSGAYVKLPVFWRLSETQPSCAPGEMREPLLPLRAGFFSVV